MSSSYQMPQIADDVRVLGMPMYSQRQWLDKLQQSQYATASIDFYNQGELVEELQTRIADKLNKPAALFFPKGMVANFCALKVAEEKRACSNVILHQMSHLAHDEADAYQHLLGLNATLLGSVNAPVAIEELIRLSGKFSSLTIEMPLRRAGFKLSPWNDLVEMSRWCQQHNIHLHMDGARLWESAPFYAKTEADISALFDSVYVSLYKGIGALGGAVLAGEVDFIERCKVWQTRFGGSQFSAFPMLITALEGLDQQLQNIAELVARAHAIARQLQQLAELAVEMPQSTGFFVYIGGDQQRVQHKALKLIQQLKIKPFNLISRCRVSGRVIIEIQVGAHHQQISDQEIVTFFQRLTE